MRLTTRMRNALQMALWFFVRPILAVRARRLVGVIKTHLQPGDSVLDLGCGDLSIGKQMVREIDVSWVGVDTIDYHAGNLEFHLYDGKNLPFEPGKFTVVVIAFVLHHCEDYDAVLREAARVAVKKLIILEDVVHENFWSAALTRFHDYVVNRFLDARIALPYNFLPYERWLRVFQSHGFHKVSAHQIRTHPFALVDQRLFVLERGTV